MPEWVLAPDDWQQMIFETKLYHVEKELQELIEEQIDGSFKSWAVDPGSFKP